jgi:ABC-type cobalamin transport system permease subunit
MSSEVRMTAERKSLGWLPSVYYYLATVIGLSVLLFGLVGGLRGLVTAALPQISSEVRYSAYEVRSPDGTVKGMTAEDKAAAKADAIERARIGGYADALYGAVAVLVGAPVFLWHLRQARRREHTVVTEP